MEKKTAKTKTTKKASTTNTAKKTTAKKEAPVVKTKTPKSEPFPDKNIFTSYIDAWQNILDYQSRSSRYDFWGFILSNFTVFFLLVILGILAGFPFVVSLFYVVASILPTLSISARRLHDTNKSGWLQLLPYGLLLLMVLLILLSVFTTLDSPSIQRFMGVFLVSFMSGMGVTIAFIYLIVLYCSKGDAGANDYGKPVYEDKIYDEKSVNLFVFTFVGVPVIGILLLIIAAFIIGNSLDFYQNNIGHVENYQYNVENYY